MILLGVTGAIGHGKSSLADTLIGAEPASLHLESFYLIAEVADAWHTEVASIPIPAAGDYSAINNWLAKLPPILAARTHTDATAEQLCITEQAVANQPEAYAKLFEHLENLCRMPSLLKQSISEANKPAYRPILQWLGGYLIQTVSPTIWWDELLRRAAQAADTGTKLVVIGGVRYPSDAAVIRQAGGQVLGIERPDVPPADLDDPTESQRHQIKPDSTVINNGRRDDLNRIAKVILSDLSSNRLEPVYRAV